ncbi:DUF4870 domain-containing protein (plasmid) [Haloferax mediterranei ATCC 33500]|uniref:Acyltransferase n=1 Tax=Haloferax mediterranei (strain ATCC 33500 / DSM 1411 / JCM 8866 / NBRC 14739 / NCIMB 2177 / R-4) TaxID=523841 RepID=I3R998_HALMT|nr:DUF4870 domain-containing protein [Haloferax mediterranei]AFK20808.1 putative acyltransferase [Haloferax mediterranei ATCC 33500]AHZ23955.1 acyltransferase [Haloferax mediterranei ATCC 33500]ELZ97521.1 putative acyltransferase [Haloferax mediterranei ATCC 33500]MDX5989738.1 DUF4870 domain-containing protein [Haloferax mediterranei ATCC 33500]QCQ77475.1 DUF4870 domain-containing protein [Haloferax mediterranei ATCC 33500]
MTSASTSIAPGPELLNERSIGGILVHLLSIPTGVVGAGIVYLVATNEFTKRNARNALDWHLAVLALTVLTFGSAFTYAELTGQGITNGVPLSAPIAAGGSFVISALFLVWMIITTCTFLVGFIATGKAIFGDAWRYPLTPALVERFSSQVELPGGWPIVIVGYVVFAPLVIGGVFLGPHEGAAFFATVFGLFGLILVLTPLTGVAMYLHAKRASQTDTAWEPHTAAYIGAPVLVAVLAYALSGAFTDSINPGGDAMYVFLAAFWVTSITYVIRWKTALN